MASKKKKASLVTEPFVQIKSNLFKPIKEQIQSWYISILLIFISNPHFILLPEQTTTHNPQDSSMDHRFKIKVKYFLGFKYLLVGPILI